ncbi:MAG: hypothetical protein ACRDG5_04380 [Anaerolineales bacterium]
MPRSSRKTRVYLEVGKKRTFAGAIDWPGWCRSGRDEGSSLQALAAYGPRYARALRPARLGFGAPANASSLAVTERLQGNATTDFGAPDASPADDAKPVESRDLRRFHAILKGCWRTLDTAADAAAGKPLRKGPRGGGRDLEAILEHVQGADASYMNRLGWKFADDTRDDLDKRMERTREAILIALKSAVAGRIPRRGPRGGVHWTARYFVRRLAWHTLDHAWEIEDRVL